MEKIVDGLINNLKNVPDLDRERICCILSTVDTEERATELLEYLEENKGNYDELNLHNILEKTWKIVGAI